MEFVYDDGGRGRYFKGEDVGCCVVRAISIALNKDFKEVYDEINIFLGYTPRNGVLNKHVRKCMKHFGFEWTPLMNIGSGCKVHMKEDELPKGTIVARLSKHLCCVKNGVLYDTYDCSRDGTRCVYGYYYLK